jgi:CBS domain-containing protein
MVSGMISEVLATKDGRLWTISPATTVFEAIQLMADKNVGAVLVMDGLSLAGVLTERDYTRKIALKGKSSKDTRVQEIVGGSPLTVTPHHTVEHCMRMMTENRVRHLPVLQEGRVIGIVSIGDLVNWIIGAQNAAITQLEGYISGHYAV